MADARIRKARRLISAGLAVIVIGTLASSTVIALRLRRAALAQAQDVVAMHSRAFEDHLTLSLQAVDITIKGIALGQARGVASAGSSALFDILRNAPHLRSVSVLDGEGRIAASSNPANVGLRVATADYFPPESANTAQLRIGATVPARDFVDAATTPARAGHANGYIPILRKLAGPDGSITVLVAINADYFLNHFNRELESSSGRISLTRYDGLTLLSNAPAVEAADAWPALTARLEQREFDVFDHRSAAGVDYITAYHASSLYPFAVTVQLERSRALAGWIHETRTMAAVILPLIAATILLGYFYYRRQRLYIKQDVAGRRMRRLAESVFEASHDAVLLTDARGCLLSVNRAFTRINGYAAEEVLGRNPSFLIEGGQTRRFQAELSRALAMDGFWQSEVVNRRSDGTHYAALLSVTAVRDAEGALLHYVATCSDISQRKEYEQELVAARDRAEAGARAKAAFLAAMSHEIRTPMNGIMGMTQLAMMSTSPEKINRFLTVAKASADSLMIILNDILDFSKAEAGRLVLEKRPFSPAKAVTDVADLFSARAAEKGIELKRDLGGNLPSQIIGDEVRVRQILTNLVSNAIKFTEAGYTAISVDLAADGTALLYRVEDTGIGVPADLQNYIFAPFAQADDSVSRKYGGTGLGLAICKQLADLMGASLAVQSAPGTGSCFTFRVPFSPTLPAQQPAGTAPESAARQRGRRQIPMEAS
jgi:PAS domain S-box-containing protein